MVVKNLRLKIEFIILNMASNNHVVNAEKVLLGKNIKFGDNCAIKCRAVVIGNNVCIGEDVKIEADELIIYDNAVIKKNVVFCSKKIKIGYKTIIDEGSTFKSIPGFSDEISIGDQSYLGRSLTVLVPIFSTGDYVSLHKNCLINGYKACSLGHNCWVGQDSILNSTEKLSIGNNVRIGTQSQIWTHVASGELLEGCILFGAHPVIIEDNVWIIGGAVISPDLIVRNGSIIMVGSVLTKSTEPKHCYAGIPAKDVTDKIAVYKEISKEEKFKMMKKFIEEFHDETKNAYGVNILLLDNLDSFKSAECAEMIVIILNGEAHDLGKKISVFSLETKNYIKKGTILEEKFIRFNLGYRARFIPMKDKI
jgi:acetyltransferase-like isoleucine patch superfamily enzyme